MSNYVKSTNFAVKDSLATGDPAKKIVGTDIDTEFNNIATAVNSKANAASAALTGTPTAPTAASGTNTTQIATTAFVAATASLSETLTNKSIDLTNNTLTATSAQLATALTDEIGTGSVVFGSGFTGTGSIVLSADAALTGVPTAPTAAAGTNSTQLATTAFVDLSAKVVQTVFMQTGTMATGDATIPLDNTIPQITEGNEFMTLAITPAYATSTLEIEVILHAMETTNTGNSVIAALFRDAGVDAIACGTEELYGLYICAPTQVVFRTRVAANSTALTTFRVRAGLDVGQITFNGSTYASAILGGTLASSIKITEYR